MAIDFPANPTNGQVYANYIYDSSITAWRNVNTDTGIGTLNAMGLKNVVPTSVQVGSGSATTNANGTVTFTNVSSITIDGTFGSTYANYFARMVCAGTTASAIRLQWVNAGSPLTGLLYNNQELISSGTTVSVGRYLAEGTTLVGYMPDSNNLEMATEMVVYKPNLSSITRANIQMHIGQGGLLQLRHNVHAYNSTQVMSGFKIVPDSGTVSGSIGVFGYTN